MLTEEEAKTKWCPFSRPVFPRVEDCGYQTGNRNSVPSDESQIMEQSSCIGSACMAWRFGNETLGHDLAYQQKQHGRDEGKIRWEKFCKEKPLIGYCGLAGRPA